MFCKGKQASKHWGRICHFNCCSGARGSSRQIRPHTYIDGGGNTRIACGVYSVELHSALRHTHQAVSLSSIPRRNPYGIRTPCKYSSIVKDPSLGSRPVYPAFSSHQTEEKGHPPPLLVRPPVCQWPSLVRSNRRKEKTDSACSGLGPSNCAKERREKKKKQAKSIGPKMGERSSKSLAGDGGAPLLRHIFPPLEKKKKRRRRNERGYYMSR